MKYQNINAQQVTKDGVKSHWELKCDDDTVIKLTPHIKDIDIFNFMDLIKSIEVEAYNSGISFQREKNNKVLEQEIKKLKSTINGLLEENERLATILEQHIKGTA